MALPRIDTPTYQTNLPSTGQEVQFRPFLVKEQKIIMMAQESGNEIEMTNALSQLVSTCTFNKIDVIGGEPGVRRDQYGRIQDVYASAKKRAV